MAAHRKGFTAVNLSRRFQKFHDLGDLTFVLEGDRLIASEQQLTPPK